MPSKFCCCLNVRSTGAIVGLIQWLGVAAGITLLVMRFNGAIVTNWNYELPVMILIAYTIPAFTWFASIFSKKSSTKSTFASVYLFFHFLIEAYCMAVPIYRLHSYWNNPSPVVPMHPILTDTSKTYGHVTVKAYLIINSSVMFSLMMLTVYVTCCLNQWAKEAIVA